MATCSKDGCERKVQARGLCHVHYYELRKAGGTEKRPRGTLEERFWTKVNKAGPDECWEWTGKRERQGYGRIMSGPKGGPQLMAHKVSYEIHKGKVPKGLIVRHICDNPCCVNPAHLLVGTYADNTADMFERGRDSVRSPSRTGENHHGSKLTEELVREIRKSDKSSYWWAKKLGMSASPIDKVKWYKTWKHVK